MRMVYVVTTPELGWECVVSVVEADSEEAAREKYANYYLKEYGEPYQEDNYIFTDTKVLE